MKFNPNCGFRVVPSKLYGEANPRNRLNRDQVVKFAFEQYRKLVWFVVAWWPKNLFLAENREGGIFRVDLVNFVQGSRHVICDFDPVTGNFCETLFEWLLFIEQFDDLSLLFLKHRCHIHYHISIGDCWNWLRRYVLRVLLLRWYSLL